MLLKTLKMSAADKVINFSHDECNQVIQYLMHGQGPRLYNNQGVLVPQSNGPAKIVSKEEKMMINVMESCVFKGCMSFVVGGALGGFLGLFSSSIAPHHTQVQMTTRETLIDMRKTISSHSKNFAVIGLM